MKSLTIEEGKLVPLIFDKMFKKVFGNPDNTKPIKKLIEIVLNEKIDSLSLLPQELISNNDKTKKNSVDVLAKLSNGRKILVEANTSFDYGDADRNLFYLARIMSEDLKVSQTYYEYHQHILINLNLKGSEKHPIIQYSINTLQPNIEEEYKTYTNKLNIYCINIPFFTEKCYNKNTEKLDEQAMFLGMLNCRDISKVNKFTKGNKLMKEIMNEVVEFSNDEIMSLAYNEEENDRYMKEMHDYHFRKKLEEAKLKHQEDVKNMYEECQKETEEAKERNQKEIEEAKEKNQKEIEEAKKNYQFEVEKMEKELINKALKLGLSEKDIKQIMNSKKE